MQRVMWRTRYDGQCRPAGDAIAGACRLGDFQIGARKLMLLSSAD